MPFLWFSRLQVIIITLVLFVILLSVSAFEVPYLSGDTKNVRVPTDSYKAAATYSETHGGYSLLIYKDGNLVFEQYARGHSMNEAHDLHSATKSFWGVLAAGAVQDKLFRLDEHVADTITEWKNDPLKSQITVYELLNLSSGLKGDKAGFDAAADRYQYVLKDPIVARPGRIFIYGPSHYYAFGIFLQRKLADRGEDSNPLHFLQRRILDPIGLQVTDWKTDSAGNPNIPNGASLQAREWIKFGQLILQHGRWGNHQVVDGELLSQLFQPSKACPCYGLTFWLNHPMNTKLPSVGNAPLIGKSTHFDRHENQMAMDFRAPVELAAALGAQGQRLYVLPSENLVIVRQGSGRSFKDSDFLNLLKV